MEYIPSKEPVGITAGFLQAKRPSCCPINIDSIKSLEKKFTVQLPKPGEITHWHYPFLIQQPITKYQFQVFYHSTSYSMTKQNTELSVSTGLALMGSWNSLE